MNRRNFFGWLLGAFGAVVALIRVPKSTGAEPEVLDTKEKVYRWLAQVEREIGVDPVLGQTARCPTEAAYLTFCNDRSRPPFKPGGRNSSKEAWSSWAKGFEVYLRHKKGKLYWRTKPELHHEMVYAPGKYMVYARAVIDNGQAPQWKGHYRDTFFEDTRWKHQPRSYRFSVSQEKLDSLIGF